MIKKVFYIILLGMCGCGLNMTVQRIPSPSQMEEKTKVENSFGEIVKAINALNERVKNLEKNTSKE